MTNPYPNLLSPLDLTGPAISIGSPTTSPNVHAAASG